MVAVCCPQRRVAIARAVGHHLQLLPRWQAKLGVAQQ